jgi:hypothetical protein
MRTLQYGSQVDFFRLITVIKAMEVHIKTGGKMMLTRVATPANLRNIASEFTGKSYPRSRKGMEKALADLLVIKESLMPM